MSMSAHILIQMRWDQVMIHEGNRLIIDPQHKPSGWNEDIREKFEAFATAYYLGGGNLATINISNHGGLGGPEIRTGGANGKRGPAHDTQ